MTVQLHSTHDLPLNVAYDNWLAVTGTRVTLDSARKFPNLATRLDRAFMEIRPLFWKLAKDMGSDSGAEYARAPTATAFGSDLGIMLAWSHILQELAKHESLTLAICNDPWLFRHLAKLPGVEAGAKPSLWRKRLLFSFRGFLSRTKVSLRMFLTSLRLRSHRANFSNGEAAILVYAHPLSKTNGFDAYFANILNICTHLKRVLHVDCSSSRANELAKDGRTASLHAWGNPMYALSLLWTQWQPSQQTLESSFAWLIRRAAAVENSGGGLAMSCWQMHCQQNWLACKKPSHVLWPWENLAWERALCRTTEKQTTCSIGYQHTVVGPHQLNYSIATNTDGLASVPDCIVANGPMYANQLKKWGIPEKQLIIGGAFRFSPVKLNLHKPEGPIFMALSGLLSVAQKQIDIARLISEAGHTVLIKEHPMYPIDFKETKYLNKTSTLLINQPGLSIVIYSTGTTGLEALLSGVPVYRLIFDDGISIDVLPPEIKMPTVTRETILETLLITQQPPSLTWTSIFSTVDPAVWTEILSPAFKLATIDKNARLASAATS